jgi:stage II sporulation protein R
MIGNSSGQNWWCVLFPPLCLSAATEKRDAEDAFIAAGLTGEQYKIITETDNVKYTARFKILEVLEDAKKYFG